MFVKLTISQANENEQAYQILRPLNEKLAIKRFTEGLRNSRLSTILTARDYTELKDTQVGEQSTSSGSIFTGQQRRGKFFNSYSGRGSQVRSRPPITFQGQTSSKRINTALCKMRNNCLKDMKLST